jgi:hypothetical protein
MFMRGFELLGNIEGSGTAGEYQREAITFALLTALSFAFVTARKVGQQGYNGSHCQDRQAYCSNNQRGKTYKIGSHGKPLS